MNFPINIHLGEKEISTHLVMEILAIFIGFRYYLAIKRRAVDRISEEDRWKIFAAVCFGALIGSRLVGVLEDPKAFYDSPNKFVYIFSNKTIIGGLLGGLWCVEFVKKTHRGKCFKWRYDDLSNNFGTYNWANRLFLRRIE